MQWLKQSTAITLKIGPFLDSTDGNTVEGGLTISQADVRLSKNGGNIAQKNEATSCTHDELGWYDCPVDTTDTNTLGRLDLMVHESGALQVWHQYMIVPSNVWDSLFGADALQVHANEITAGLITAAAIATGAIDADALATDAVDEIVDAVWNETSTGHTDAGKAGEQLWTDVDAILVDTGTTLQAEVDGIQADTEDIQTRLPAALVSGRIDASVGAMAANVMTAAAAAADLTTELQAGLATQASVDTIDDFLDTEIAAILAAVDTEVAAIKAKTDQLTFTTPNQVDATSVTSSDKTGYRLSATGVDDIHDEVIEGTTTLRQSIRLANSANGAKVAGAATTTVTIRDLADSKNRVSATVDADGNRSAVTLDLA